MQIAVGNILEGKVTGITKFGAFVDIGEGKTGMVHISEVAPSFVNDIHDHLQLNQEVKVKVININEQGKISLSIKQTMEPSRPRRDDRQPRDFKNNRFDGPRRGSHSGNGGYNRKSRNFNQGQNRPTASAKNIDSFEWNPRKNSSSGSFEDMMSKFKQSSDDKMSDLKKTMDVKRGSANRRSSKPL